MCKFQMWTEISAMTIPNEQSSSVPFFVELMRLIEIESILGCMAASLLFFPLFTKMWCHVRNI